MSDAILRNGDHITKKEDQKVTWNPFEAAPTAIHLNAEKSSAASAKMVAAGTIPALHLTGADAAKPATPQEASAASKNTEAHPQGILGTFESGAMHFLSGAGKVTKDLASGAWNEVTQHPLQVAEKVGEGAVIATVAGAALVGAAAIAPEALLAVGAGEAVIGLGSLAIGAYKVGTHAAGWAHDAHVVSNEHNYSKEQIASAHSDLKHVGAETALVTAGVVGGLAVAPFAAGALDSVTSSADRAAFASGARGFETGPSSDDTVTGVLGRAVQSGQYEARDVKGVTVLFPKSQPTVSDVLSNAVTSGQYEVQNINGVGVLMPKAQPTVMDILANAVKSGKYRADTINGVTVFNPR